MGDRRRDAANFAEPPFNARTHTYTLNNPFAVEEDEDGWVLVHEEGAPERRGLVPASYIRRDM